MPAAQIRRRWGTVDRFHLLGSPGFVSDDTVQTALVAESLALHPDDPERCAAAFRRRMVAWFFRLPFGVGLATVRACLRAAAGLRPSGVPSAGNGAAMRAVPVGLLFHADPEARTRFGRALAEVTHRDERAISGALFVAEVAAGCVTSAPGEERRILERAADRILCAPLAEAVRESLMLAGSDLAPEEAAARLGSSGYVLHSTALAAFYLARFGSEAPLSALSRIVAAGGDTDSSAAILGGWLGALHGEGALPPLVSRIQDGPFGPTHLRGLADALARAAEGREAAPPPYSGAVAMGRNLSLFPVILAHGFRRLLPF
jgi:ADP-ribosylglycohydrolase